VLVEPWLYEVLLKRGEGLLIEYDGTDHPVNLTLIDGEVSIEVFSKLVRITARDEVREYHHEGAWGPAPAPT
jgi:hypothetical protein